MFQLAAGVFAAELLLLASPLYGEAWAAGQLAAPRCGKMQEAVLVAWGVAGALGVGGCPPESAA